VICNPGRSRMFSSSTRIDDHFKERCIHDMTENEGCIHDMTENEEGDSSKILSSLSQRFDWMSGTDRSETESFDSIVKQ